MFDTINKLFGMFQKVLLAILTLALAAMMCVIIVQVFTRYVIFYSLPWSEELSRYFFVFIVVCGINVAVSREILIKIDAVQNSFKTVRGRLGMDIFHAAVGLLACVLIAVYATDLFPVGRVQKSPAMRIPMIIMYSIVCFGYCVSAVSLLLKMIEKIKAFNDPKNKGVRISQQDDIETVMNGEGN